MTSELDKFFSRLDKKEFTIVMKMVEKITNLNLVGLNIKKLEGHKNVFRVKKGGIRIIYYIENNRGKIISVVRRSEKTYRDF